MRVDPFWAGKSVLVTGATGFLGGWLVHDLIERGANVIALVRRRRRDSQLFLAGYDGRVTVVTGDASDRSLLEHVIEHHGVEAIFHTAMSGGGVEATLAEPVQCLQSTVQSTWWLLDVLRRVRPDVIMVVCSSDKAYGNQEVPYRESQALRPSHPQEVAKASQDLIAQSFGKVYDLNVAVTRCGNFFGPYDFNFSRIIPYVARCCALGEQPRLRSNGRFVRDFLSIQEASLAHLTLAEEVGRRPELRGEAFNFSYEVRIQVEAVVSRILGHSNSRLTPILGCTARNEIPSMGLNCEKARKVLGWTPRKSFDERLAATIDWYAQWFRRAVALVVATALGQRVSEWCHVPVPA